jgi:hypothetical protein
MKTAALFLLCSLPAAGGPMDRLMVLRHTEGETSNEYHYTTKGETTRIDRHGEPTVPPSPWNLIDHATGDITVIRPHNQSISTIPASAFARGQGPSAPNSPASLPDLSELPPEVAAAVKAAHQRAANPASVATAPPPASPPVRIGPDPSLLPEGVKIPEMPEPTPPMPIPTPPGGMPGGIPGGPPPMQTPGVMPIPQIARPISHQLVTHEQTRALHGFESQASHRPLKRSRQDPGTLQ